MAIMLSLPDVFLLQPEALRGGMTDLFVILKQDWLLDIETTELWPRASMLLTCSYRNLVGIF